MTNSDKVTTSPQGVSVETANSTHEDQPFEERLEEALKDENMHRALERFVPSWRASRRDVFAAEEADYGSEFSFEQMRGRRACVSAVTPAKPSARSRSRCRA